MKIDFIRRGAETRLILIFSGWSTDASYYDDCIVDGWDTAVVSDYTDMAVPEIPSQYSIIYIFGYSLGVFAASMSGIKASAYIAVCGTPCPVSDRFGIPEKVYEATVANLSLQGLAKFHLRMAGNKKRYEEISVKLPVSPDIIRLQKELHAIATNSSENINDTTVRWDKAYIASDDRIFPAFNQKEYWMSVPNTTVVELKGSHAADIAAIVRSNIPDFDRIGEGFSKAKLTYNDNAVIQAEICDRICDKLKMIYGQGAHVGSLLEIGVGSGLLSYKWNEVIVADKSVYVDIVETPEFGFSADERYIRADAERWLEETDEKFDLILSASTVQWFADPINFMHTVKKHLNEGGKAIISTFVRGNLGELDAIRPVPIIYHSADDYITMEGMEADEWRSSIHFNTPRDLLMHLRLTGVSPVSRKDKFEKAGSARDNVSMSALPDSLTYAPLILTIHA